MVFFFVFLLLILRCLNLVLGINVLLWMIVDLILVLNVSSIIKLGLFLLVL